jgi:hypothetical protein
MFESSIRHEARHPKKVAFLFYEGMIALDVIGPHEVLS